MLMDARDKFELDKAKAVLQHGQWMASKKDKKTYGSDKTDVTAHAAVTYNFIVGDRQTNIEAEGPKQAAKEILETEYKALPVALDLENLDKVPDHVIGKVYTGVDAAEPETNE